MNNIDFFKDKLSEERLLKQKVQIESKSRVKSPVSQAVDTIFSHDRDQNKNNDQHDRDQDCNSKNKDSIDEEGLNKADKNKRLHLLTSKLNYKLNGGGLLSDRLIVENYNE